MALFYIGIDDTDNDTSPGTGQLARRLQGEAIERGAIRAGITRHQFLIDARIPFTSHNSGACIGLEWPGAIYDLGFAFDLIQQWAAEGSDPGVCIVSAEGISRAVMDYGWRATREVLTIDSALELASACQVQLRALGGTGQGVIGALSSVGLRAEGNEGRFLDLPGLRDLGEFVSQNELDRIGITVERALPDLSQKVRIGASSENDRDKAIYRTSGWVRPRLIGGKAVWPVTWSDAHESWIGVDQKRSRPLE